jgi:hypothetical protein
VKKGFQLGFLIILLAIAWVLNADNDGEFHIQVRVPPVEKDLSTGSRGDCDDGGGGC